MTRKVDSPNKKHLKGNDFILHLFLKNLSEYVIENRICPHPIRSCILRDGQGIDFYVISGSGIMNVPSSQFDTVP